MTGCDSSGTDATDEETEELRKVSYDLAAQPNDGAIADGVDGTVTFWEVNAQQTIVTVEFDEGATDTDVVHPAHIHDAESGDIAIYLTPVDGSGGGGTSARIVNQSYDALRDFDGYVNVHESVENLGIVVSQGDIGANASGSEDEGLSPVSDPRSTSYTLGANTNEGTVAPDGIPAEATLQELTDDLTLVTLALDVNGATGASVSHPAHIHASSDNSIQYYLSPIDGSDEDAVSSKLVSASYDKLTDDSEEFDGYINIHESVTNLGAVVSQGDIGSGTSDDSDGGY